MDKRLIAVCAAATAAVAIGCASAPSEDPPPSAPDPLISFDSGTPAPTFTTDDPPTPTFDATEADEGDLGAGKPGAFCATNRLGKHFTKDGVTYTCKGPKPYRWRRSDG